MRRSAVVLCAVLAALLVPLVGFLAWNPLHLRHAGAAVEPVAGLAVVSVAGLLTLVVRRRAVQVIIVVLGLVGLLLVGAAAWLDAMFHDPGREVTRVSGPDGRYELAVVRVAPFVTIDPYEEVRVRSGHGVLAREAVVWEGTEDGPGVQSVRFTGPRTVEVVVDNGCRYRSTFDGLTLRPHPVHHGRSGPAC